MADNIEQCSDHGEDDSLQLSDHALAALQEFYDEQKQIQQMESNSNTNTAFKENWQLSQFWYNEETTQILVDECIRECGQNGRIACVATPTIFQSLIQQSSCPIADNSILFEYDRRFAVHGDKFVYYDFNNPLDLPQRVERGSFDIIMADPPFLSEECIEKFAETINYLKKDKIILCTGSVMEGLVYRLLGVNRCSFEPKHKNGLSNSFSCYVNYNSSCLL